MATKKAKALQAAAAIPPSTKLYHILDPGVVTAKLGGVDIQGEGDERFVIMNDAQARYFVDQGTIGEKPPSGKKAEAAHAQQIGHGDDVIEKKKK